MVSQRHFAVSRDVGRGGSSERDAGVAAEISSDESRQFAQCCRHREEILFQFDEAGMWPPNASTGGRIGGVNATGEES
jgi:hypothetical protein